MKSTMLKEGIVCFGRQDKIDFQMLNIISSEGFKEHDESFSIPVTIALVANHTAPVVRVMGSYQILEFLNLWPIFGQPNPRIRPYCLLMMNLTNEWFPL